MFARKKKVEGGLGAVRPENRLLRLFRSSDVFQGSLVSLEGIDREDAYSGDPKMIRNAMLEVEYQSAKALQAFRNSSRFY